MAPTLEVVAPQGVTKAVTRVSFTHPCFDSQTTEHTATALIVRVGPELGPRQKPSVTFRRHDFSGPETAPKTVP